jgi:hypothetical protein
VTDKTRRSDYDVTDTVQVSSPAAVRAAVLELYGNTWPGAPTLPLGRAIDDFALLFTGRMPGYQGVDTVYHDMQHSLDMVLATARLLNGYERSCAESARFGAERGLVTLVVALLHDSGYIREDAERDVPNGAVFTKNHVARGARLIARFLPQLGLAHWVPVATRIVHFTGYEVPFDSIRLADPRDRKAGHLLGTADLLAQMADRCYLEKCRDRLYAEFVLGGVAVAPGPQGVRVQYGSGLDLLRQTPYFVQSAFDDRLRGEFDHAYRYMEPVFNGTNPYMEAIERHLAFVEDLSRTGRWPMLRRQPPIFTANDQPMQTVRALVVDHLTGVWAKPAGIEDVQEPG